MRRCGDCQLCCKLLPMDSRERGHESAAAMIEAGLATVGDFRNMRPHFDKAARVRCPHQRHGKGCMIYQERPFSCRVWACRWLTEDDTADLRRPDRSHYVIDVMPDFVTLRNNETGAEQHLQVVQVWIDPDYPDAHRDPALRAYIERLAANGMACQVRFGPREAITIFAPRLSEDGQWHEVTNGVLTEEHSAEQRLAALGPLHITFKREEAA